MAPELRLHAGDRLLHALIAASHELGDPLNLEARGLQHLIVPEEKAWPKGIHVIRRRADCIPPTD
jgi:hypothetical protein